MLKLKNLERWGQVRTKKHAVIQTTSIMITEPNTHIHTVVMLKLKPEGVGAGQDKKTCCNSNNKYHDYAPNTRTYTDTLPMTIKYHEHINIYTNVFIYIYIYLINGHAHMIPI